MDQHLDRRDEATMDVIDGLVTGEMGRDDFIKRMAVLGFSASAIGGILAAAGKADASAGRAFAGKTISILVAAEGDDKGVKDKIPEIKKRFGIDVKMTALPVGPLNEKLSQNVKAPTSSFDAIMVLGFTVSAFVGGGFFEPLNKYLKKAPAGYDFPKDFPQGELNYVGYYDVQHQRAGGKTLYLIPGLHGGSVVLFYRKDLFKAAGLQPPTTWPAYLNAAKKLNTGGVAGNSLIAKSGDVSMFLCDWYTRFVNMGGILMSGSPQAKNYRPRLTSPAAVGALQHMVDCVKYASPGVQSYDFTVSTDAFSAGKTAMMLIWSTIAGPVYNPATSKVAGKVAVAVPPVKGQAVRGGLGDEHPEERACREQGRGVDRDHVPDVEGVGALPDAQVPDRSDAELDLLQPGAEQETPVPGDGRTGVPEGAEPRDRQHPGDLRADHHRRAGVRCGTERIVDGRRGVQEGERQMDGRAQARRSSEVGVAA